MKHHLRSLVSVLAAGLAIAVAGCSKSEPPAARGGAAAADADRIYFGGDIVTVNDGQPTAEAVAVKDGKILAVGTRVEVEKAHRGRSTQEFDLAGKTLVPGFIDGHGHIFNVGIQALTANLLAPPDGTVKSIAELQETLRAWGKTPASAKLGWIIGMGYDEGQLAEQRHPTRDDLDAISKDVPILAIHQSGHLAAINSKALELANITAASVNPAGGVIRRRAGSKEPDGVLEESAFWMVLGALPKLTPEDYETIARAGQDMYLRFGFTTAQEGRSTPGVNKVWGQLGERGVLKLDIVSYPDITTADVAMKSPFVGSTYKNHFRIGGVKLSLDGSPQGRTAWLTKPYYKVPAGQKADYLGYPAFKPEEVMAFVDRAFANNWQLLAHVSGDAAIDELIAAVRAAETRYGKGDRRTVAIHAHIAREDQLDAFKELGIFPSLFTMHTFYWGDWHVGTTFGLERGSNIEPTGWAMARGMMFSSHHDAPVALPDSMRVYWSTVNRVARGSGKVIGPDQRVSAIVGLKSITLWAAYQHFEEKSKGSIEAGKLADFVVLSDNPIKVDPLKIIDIKVIETIKEGQTVYSAR